MADETGQEVEDDILKPVKDLRDNVAGAVSKAKNWLSGNKPAPTAPTPKTNQVDPEDVRKATATFAERDATPPAKPTKPGQRIMAGKKVQSK